MLRATHPVFAAWLWLIPATSPGDFIDEFGPGPLNTDPSALLGWSWHAGDGEALVDFTQAEGVGHIAVDATADRRNIWWTFIRRAVSPAIDVTELARPDRELRVEARVRANVAPRRINLHVNHSRTTDFHSHLMEYDLPEADTWQDISFTTYGFDPRQGDEVFVQLALMDWGGDRYQLDIDRIGVRVVDPGAVGPDRGTPLPYRPQAQVPGAFAHRLPVAADTIVDPSWPQVNFADWRKQGTAGGPPLLAVGGTRITLLRWDLAQFQGRRPEGWGLLTLTTEAVYRAETGLEEFGLLRVVEILAGDPTWQRETATWEGFTAAHARAEVLNPQLMIDLPPASEAGGLTLVPVSPPVLQRLLSGRSLGLAIQAQGALSATFLAGSGAGGPELHFNLQ
jgi:hypothetical protein